MCQLCPKLCQQPPKFVGRMAKVGERLEKLVKEMLRKVNVAPIGRSIGYLKVILFLFCAC